jgi:hypothetical protein
MLGGRKLRLSQCPLRVHYKRTVLRSNIYSTSVSFHCELRLFDPPNARKLGASILAILLLDLFYPCGDCFVGESNMFRFPRFVIEARVCRCIVAVLAMKVNRVLK